MRILVCEDDNMIIKAIQHKLTAEGYDVDVAMNGDDAMSKLREEQYDIILTDILMPLLGGLDLIVKVRDELKITTPIIVLSRLGNEETILEAFQRGADDYITKPFSPNELAMRIKRYALKRR
ncbi:Transcriptional regulatory protein SrrA [bioreactor metagenome]|uniref:Transcriptional regulatory protein SrrA n=1 Tax=bioreactor metagenome TaxID=1076179 RepID=A0A645BJI6_9ZZZZ